MGAFVRILRFFTFTRAALCMEPPQRLPRFTLKGRSRVWKSPYIPRILKGTLSEKCSSPGPLSAQQSCLLLVTVYFLDRDESLLLPACLNKPGRPLQIKGLRFGGFEGLIMLGQCSVQELCLDMMAPIPDCGSCCCKGE